MEIVHPGSRSVSGSCDGVGSGQDDPRHMGMTAYRCYLPVLTGFTGSHCAGPGHRRHFPPPIARRARPLTREFGPAEADCGYRAPLAPRLARSPEKNGGDDRIRTDDPLVANEVLSQLSYIPTLYHQRRSAFTGRQSRPMAEREGFEPSEQKSCSTVFETVPFNRSGISPSDTIYNQSRDINSREPYFMMFD